MHRYNDIEMAFVLQRFDKSLPEPVHKGIYREYVEAGWDVLEMRNTMDINQTTCPVCRSDLYHFEFYADSSEFGVMNQYGDVIRVTNVRDTDGFFWDPEAQATGDHFMCKRCKDSFGNLETNRGSIRLHLPEGSDYNSEDQITGATTHNGVVRFDDYWYNDRSLWIPLCDVSNSLDMEVFVGAKAIGKTKYEQHLEANGWREIQYHEFNVNMDPFTAETKLPRLFKRVVDEWSKLNTKIVSGIDEPYLMIDGSRLFTTYEGYDQVYNRMATSLQSIGLEEVPSSHESE